MTRAQINSIHAPKSGETIERNHTGKGKAARTKERKGYRRMWLSILEVRKMKSTTLKAKEDDRSNARWGLEAERKPQKETNGLEGMLALLLGVVVVAAKLRVARHKRASDRRQRGRPGRLRGRAFRGRRWGLGCRRVSGRSC
jgi:hypothetical protein